MTRRTGKAKLSALCVANIYLMFSGGAFASALESVDLCLMGASSCGKSTWCELSQLNPKAAAEAAYMLSNGMGKQRANQYGSACLAKSWQLLWLSAGEISLAQHMAEAKQQIRAGQSVRLLDLPMPEKRKVLGFMVFFALLILYSR